jgi:hypothetical protein
MRVWLLSRAWRSIATVSAISAISAVSAVSAVSTVPAVPAVSILCAVRHAAMSSARGSAAAAGWSTKQCAAAVIEQQLDARIFQLEQLQQGLVQLVQRAAAPAAAGMTGFARRHVHVRTRQIVLVRW